MEINYNNIVYYAKSLLKTVLSTFTTELNNMKSSIIVILILTASLCYSQQISHISINSIGENLQKSSNGIGVSIGEIILESQVNSAVSLGAGNFTAVEIGAPCNGTLPPDCQAAKVVSIFSDAYDNVPIETWLGAGSIATYSDLELNGNEVKFYENVTIINIETIAPDLINASGMKYLHIDFWTEDITTFKINILDFAIDEIEGEGDVEMEYMCNNIPICQWNSFLVPVSTFVNLSPNSKIGKLIITGMPTEGSIYFDNIYFCEE